MYRSPDTSWPMSAIGKSGARSSGPTGSCVAGCSGGGGGSGRSATRLYHRVGIDASSSKILVGTVMASLPSHPLAPPSCHLARAVRQDLTPASPDQQSHTQRSTGNTLVLQRGSRVRTLP